METGKKNPTYKPYMDYDEAQKPKSEKKMRICVKCNETKLTSNINNVFTCDKCQWEAWYNPPSQEL